MPAWLFILPKLSLIIIRSSEKGLYKKQSKKKLKRNIKSIIQSLL